MKRKREEDEEEAEKKRSEIDCIIEELSVLKIKLMPKTLTPHVDVDDDNDNLVQDSIAYIPTKPFLHICELVLQVLDKIGPIMTVLRRDINQNIQRLELLFESDPSKYSNLIEVLKKDFKEGNARKGHTCSKAFLWLTRSLDFTSALLHRMTEHPTQTMEQYVEESYNLTLKPWHGWISSAALKVALKLVPDKKTFHDILIIKGESNEDLRERMQTLVSLLVPFLDDIHSILKAYDVDGLKSA
ncbi:hypothetical protein ACFE04_011900 [Oxalis oulophora]